MTACGVRASPALACLSILLLAPLIGGVAAAPTLHPPATNVEVGDIGVVNGNAYTTTKDGILVSPGTTITITADYLFRDLTGPNGYTAHNIAVLRINGATGQIGADSVGISFSSPGAYSWNGTLSVTLTVPENVRSVSAVLDARLTHSWSGGSKIVDESQASAALTVVAVPHPVQFASDDLVVADALDVGTITFTTAEKAIAAESGKTFVSTDLGTRLHATAIIERPTVSGMSNIWHHTSVSLSAQIEGGIGYSSARTVFFDHCSDWTTHACSLAGETRTVTLELVIPSGVGGPRNVLTTSLHVNHDLSTYDATTGQGSWEGYMASASGRHVALSV